MHPEIITCYMEASFSVRAGDGARGGAAKGALRFLKGRRSGSLAEDLAHGTRSYHKQSVLEAI
jgi:hypothetical protein